MKIVFCSDYYCSETRKRYDDRINWMLSHGQYFGRFASGGPPPPPPPGPTAAMSAFESRRSLPRSMFKLRMCA